MFVRVFVLAVLAIAGTSCAHRVETTPGRPRSETFVTLHGHPLRLHLHLPETPLDRPILVYATGDGGWWGGDVTLFEQIEGWGYPAVGFSAREYVHHLGKDAVNPDEVAGDYEAIIATAVEAMRLAGGTRAVLVGKSRGAGLAVAAAVHRPLQPALAGVLAVGLTREEEYVRGHGSESREIEAMETYARLVDIGDVPVAVIQSTRDSYVPAAEARRLFGPDTPSRALVAIDARNHNFGGAEARLYDEMRHSVEWLVSR